MKKPYCNKLIPTFAIRRRLDQIHVSTPFSEIEKEIRERAGKHAWNEKDIKQAVRYAKWYWEQVTGLYHSVMTGKF